MKTEKLTRAEPHRSLDMLDREVGLAGPYPDLRADRPTTCRARIEPEGPINERHHSIDVLTEIRECMGGVGQGVRIIAGGLERALSVLDRGATVSLRGFGPAAKID